MVVEKFVEFKEPGRKKKNLTQSRLRPVSPPAAAGLRRPKTQRRKGSDLERVGVWTYRVWGEWSGNVHLCHAGGLKVIDDSVDTICQEILSEIDQEA
jgi:hypothetical protein